MFTRTVWLKCCKGYIDAYFAQETKMGWVCDTCLKKVIEGNKK